MDAFLMGVLTMVVLLIIRGIVELIRHLRDKSRERRGVGIDWEKLSEENPSNREREGGSCVEIPPSKESEEHFSEEDYSNAHREIDLSDRYYPATKQEGERPDHIQEEAPIEDFYADPPQEDEPHGDETQEENAPMSEQEAITEEVPTIPAETSESSEVGMSNVPEDANDDGGHDYNLKEHLLALCSPENFMNPYNPKKVKAAKELYDRLKRMDDSDISELSDIRKTAEKSLGVRVDVEKFYRHLMEIFSPKDFIDGDAEEFNRRNQICAELLANKGCMDGLEYVLIKLRNQKIAERQRVEKVRRKEGKRKRQEERAFDVGVSIGKIAGEIGDKIANKINDLIAPLKRRLTVNYHLALRTVYIKLTKAFEKKPKTNK